MKLVFCKNTGETFTNYKEYLKSDHWKNVKKRYKDSKLTQKCYICGSNKHINIHHKTYKRLGKEKLNDLVPLCQECHYLTHKALGISNSQNLNLWNMAKRIKKVNEGKYALKNLRKL